MSPLLRLPYRALQKLAVFEIAATLVAPTEEIGRESTRPEVRRLRRDDLLRHFARDEAPGCWPFIDRLRNPKLRCYGAVDGGRLVSFAWSYEGGAEARMNFGYHPGTATAIELAGDAAFLFHLHTAPDARGRGWMGELLRHAAAGLHQERGVRSLVTTTEIINRPALAVLEKSGFMRRANYCRYGFGRWATGLYPPPAAPIQAFG